jgi:DNA processing protein
VAVEEEFVVVSGFALGADTIGHKAAVAGGGKTICVMPSGLDRPFPPENRTLWQSFLAGSQAVFVSEFAFGTGAASLNLRKRNKMIVAFSKGVLVSQSARTGGAMNAYRFALEQKKQLGTFRPNGTEDTSGNDQISRDEVAVKVTVFDGPDPEAFKRWLRELSSLT